MRFPVFSPSGGSPLFRVCHFGAMKMLNFSLKQLNFLPVETYRCCRRVSASRLILIVIVRVLMKMVHSIDPKAIHVFF